MSKVSVGDVLIQDLWVHFAALIVVALGVVSWYSQNGFRADPSALALSFIIAGLAGMGLKIVNGSAAQLRQAALDTAFSAARTAQQASQIATTVAAAAPAPISPPAPPAQGG